MRRTWTTMNQRGVIQDTDELAGNVFSVDYYRCSRDTSINSRTGSVKNF